MWTHSKLHLVTFVSSFLNTYTDLIPPHCYVCLKPCRCHFVFSYLKWELRDGCSLGWYWWNCWQCMTLSFIFTTTTIGTKYCCHDRMIACFWQISSHTVVSSMQHYQMDFNIYYWCWLPLIAEIDVKQAIIRSWQQYFVPMVVVGFLHQYNWPPRYNWNIVASGVKHAIR
jgi:hypothetical protein